jgi:hypothetical protein
MGAVIRAVGAFALHPVTLLVVAIISGIVGAALTFDAPLYAERMARAERLRPLDAAGLERAALGSPIMLEGTISARNPAVYRSFVAYVREEYRSDWLSTGSTSQRWVEVERVTPPLLVTVAGGDVRVVNGTYAFDTTARTVAEAEPTFTEGAVQSRGYGPGDPVLVIGSAAGRAGDVGVSAELLFAGTRDEYIASLRRLAVDALPAGVASLLLCAAATGALVVQVRRFLREPPPAQATRGPTVPRGRKKGRSPPAA